MALTTKLVPMNTTSKTEPDYFSMNSFKKIQSNKNLVPYLESIDKKKEIFKESFSQTSKAKKKTINCKKIVILFKFFKTI
jgi:hypothetical protein